jgi:hypothetical protein
MATIKDKFSKGLATINLKTNTFMEQNKIKTYISTLEDEIKALKAQIGETVYTKWASDAFDVACVEDALTKIKEKYAEIEVQKEKMEQLIIEEQQILGTSTEQPAVNTAAQGNVFCSSCGAPNPANYKFCTKCGSAL